MFDHFGLPHAHLILLIIGILCLTIGGRFLPLIMALTGFYLGGRLAKVYWGTDSPFSVILFALFTALAGAILPKVSKTVALTLAAFAIGGFVFSSYLGYWEMVAPQYEVVLFIIFGLLAAIFSTVMFDLGLAVISSILGAALLVSISGGGKMMQAMLFAGLTLAGVLIQTGLLGKDLNRAPRSSKGRTRS